MNVIIWRTSMIRKGVDASGQPYTMIRDRDGTRYEYPEGKSVWSGFNNELGMGGGISFCQDCDAQRPTITHCTVGDDNKQRCEEHHNLYIHMRNVRL